MIKGLEMGEITLCYPDGLNLITPVLKGRDACPAGVRGNGSGSYDKGRRVREM